MKPSVSDHLSPGVVFVAALAAAFALGAWQGRHTPSDAPVVAAAQRSAFAQSGGVAVESDRGVPDAAEALAHARPSAAGETAASTF